MLTLDWLLWHCLLSDCLKICNINIKIIGKFWRSGMAKNEEPWWHLSGTPPSLILLNTNTISIHLYAILRTIIYIKNGIYTTTSAIVIWYAQILHLYSGAIKCNTIHQHQHQQHQHQHHKVKYITPAPAWGSDVDQDLRGDFSQLSKRISDLWCHIWWINNHEKIHYCLQRKQEVAVDADLLLTSNQCKMFLLGKITGNGNGQIFLRSTGFAKGTNDL